MTIVYSAQATTLVAPNPEESMEPGIYTIECRKKPVSRDFSLTSLDGNGTNSYQQEEPKEKLGPIEEGEFTWWEQTGTVGNCATIAIINTNRLITWAYGEPPQFNPEYDGEYPDKVRACMERLGHNIDKGMKLWERNPYFPEHILRETDLWKDFKDCKKSYEKEHGREVNDISLFYGPTLNDGMDLCSQGNSYENATTAHIPPGDRPDPDKADPTFIGIHGEFLGDKNVSHALSLLACRKISNGNYHLTVTDPLYPTKTRILEVDKYTHKITNMDGSAKKIYRGMKVNHIGLENVR